MFTRINSTKSPASGEDNVRGPGMMTQVRIVRYVLCAYISVLMQMRPVYVGLTTLLHSCAVCLEIWEPQPPGTVRACPGLCREYFQV